MGLWESTELGHHCGVGLCFQRVKKDPRKKWRGVSFLHPSGLAAHDQLLPVELFVEKEDQEVDIYFSSIK